MHAFKATNLGLVAACCTFITGNAASLTDLKSVIEGVYILDEWNSDGKVFRPPQVEGRFVLLNGNVVTILINTAEESAKTYNSVFGVYSLTTNSFSYKYETRAGFTETSEKILLSRAIPWEGMREFALTQQGDSVHLQYGEKAAFDVNPAGLTYSEGGKPLRVWHRARSE